MEELAQKDAEKDKAEKNLKSILKEEISDSKKASEEIKLLTNSEDGKKQIVAIQEELAKAEEKSTSSQAKEFKKAAELVQNIKEVLPEIAKGTLKNANEIAKKDSLEVAIDSFKEKEQAVEKKKEEVLEVIKKIAIDDKNKNGENSNKENPSVIKPPETEKDWGKLIKQSNENAKNSDSKKAENQTPLTKPLEELALKDAEKNNAGDNLKAVLKDEIKDAKKASDEIAKSAKTGETKKQISEVNKNIETAESKSVSTASKEIIESGEIIQKVKTSLPEIAKASIKNEELNNNHDPLAKALDSFKEKEQAVEKKKEEVLEVIKKIAIDDKNKNGENSNKENPSVIKPPETEKDWGKLIKQSNENAKNSDSKKAENQTPLTKPLEELALKDADKNKAEEELKKVLKDEIGAAKKASDEVVRVAKTEEVKKLINEVKKKIDVAESKSTSTEAKNFKEAAETIETVKKEIPEIAGAEKNNVANESKERMKPEKPNKTASTEASKNNKDISSLKIDLDSAKELVEKSLQQLNKLKSGMEDAENNPAESLEKQISKADLVLKDLSLPKPAGVEKQVTAEQLKEPKDNLNKAHSSVDELKGEVGIKEKEIKKEVETLKKNLTENEAKNIKEKWGSLEEVEKKIS